MTANQDFNSNNISNHEFNIGHSQKGISSTKPYEFFLTQEQVKQIQKFLPPGYSVTNSKPQKVITKRTSTGTYNLDESRVSAHNVEKTKREAYYKAEQKIKEPVEFLKRCESILSALKKHKFGFPFMEPVDPEVLGIPDYFQVIKEPMDFSKVEKRLRSGFYKNMSEFEEDIWKIWDNATTYNKPNTEIYHMTLEISTFFKSLLQEEDHVYSPPVMTKIQNPHKPSKKQLDYEAVDLPYKPSKVVSVTKHSTDRPLTYQEKKALSEMIRQLPSESLWEVWKIVSPENQNQGEELEFDIDTLSPKTSRELERFVKSKLQTLSSKKSKPKAPQSYANDPIKPFSSQNSALPQTSAPVYQPHTVATIGQTRETAYPVVQKEVQVNKDDTSNSSFLSNLSESDDN